ncbi:MAG: hypothetical protein OSB44_05560 [Verrucomicrobiales bacterium]|nr:hypothetical protein [Verrucomicrobiales bacterium]
MIPSRREEGHDPKRVTDDSDQDLGRKIDAGVESPQSDEEVFAAICRGDLEIFPARKIAGGKIVFGCPFCSRPIELKRRLEGKETVCAHCSGKLIAPELSNGNTAVPLSGSGGMAGAQSIELPEPKRVDNKVSSIISSSEDSFNKSILVHEVERRLKKNELPKLISKEEAEAGFDMSAAWKSYPEYSRGIYFYLKRFGATFMILLILAVTVVIIVQQSKLRSEKHHLSSQGLVIANVDDKYFVILKEFSSAKTIQERLKYVRIPEVINPKMLEAYADLRDGLVLPSIDLSSLSEVSINGLNFCKIQSSVTTVPHYLYFQIKEEGEVLLDWESAVGYGEVDVRAFSKWPSDRPVKVRVLARPAQFYAYEYKDRSMNCYALTDLRGKILMYGYVNSGDKSAELMKGLDFGVNDKRWAPCILNLKAPKLSERRRPMQVLIENVDDLGEGWLAP